MATDTSTTMKRYNVEERKDVVVRIRLSSHIKRKLDARAQQVTLGNISLFLRTLILEELGQPLSMEELQLKEEIGKNGKLTPEYVAGLVDGEGCFCVSILNAKDSKIGYRTHPVFTVGMTDKDTVEEVREFFGSIGSLDKIKYKEEKIMYRFSVNSLIGCFKVAKFFQKYPFLRTKRIVFQKWVKLLKLIREDKHLTKRGLIEIIKIRDTMNPTRRPNSVSLADVETTDENCITRI